MDRRKPGLLLLTVLLLGCGSKPRVSLPPPTPARMGAVEEGIASWYGHPYHGRRTSSGEVYDMNRLTAAHLSLPFGTRLEVTNLHNGRRVVVSVNDRGPFVKNRVIDLSRAAAQSLAMLGPGTARVRLKVVGVPPSARAAAHDDRWTRQTGWEEDSPGAAADGLTVSELGDPEADCPGGPYYSVQVGSFRVVENAERMRGKMFAQYGAAQMIAVSTSEGPLYRVVVGRWVDGAAAQRFVERLGRDRVDGIVTRVDESDAPDCL